MWEIITRIDNRIGIYFESLIQEWRLLIVLMIFKLSIDVVFGVVELPINDDTSNTRSVDRADFPNHLHIVSERHIADIPANNP